MDPDILSDMATIVAWQHSEDSDSNGDEVRLDLWTLLVRVQVPLAPQPGCQSCSASGSICTVTFPFSLLTSLAKR